MKVRIKQLPKRAYGGQQPDGALDVAPAAWGGAGTVENANNKVKKTLSSVPRSQANLEAEGGETAFGPISGDTIPDHMVIKGPRHTNGGVPLNLPEDTFIFSDTKAMKIKDPKVLKMFGKTRKKGGYTPAELAKPYDINKYKAILMDPDSDRKDRNNAELMIKNYIMKLGALAIAQESKKGFPQGIPEMARPYMEANGISEEDLMPKQEQMAQEDVPQEDMPQEGMVQYGGTPKYPHGGDFHPAESFEDKMKKTLNADISIGDPESIFRESDAKSGIFTPENPYVNSVTGKSPALMTDPKTGKYVEVEQPEKSEDEIITFEQKINDAYDVDMNMLADQGAWTAGAIGNFADGINKEKRIKSTFDKSMDKDSKEPVFAGLHYANTPGVVAPSGSSPTTINSYKSQFGGELDRFVYGGVPVAREGMSATNPNMPESCPQGQGWNGILGKCQPIEELRMFYRNMHPEHPRRNAVFGELGKARMNADDSMFKLENLFDGDAWGDTFYHVGSQIYSDFGPDGYAWGGKERPKFSKEYTDPPGFLRRMLDPILKKQQYGGTPMSLYGMEMGGSYYPTMSTGGTRRVKITALPKADNGKTVKEKMTKEQLEKRRPSEINVGERTDGMIDMGDGVFAEGEFTYRDKDAAQDSKELFSGTDEAYLDAICNRMKNGDLKGLPLSNVIDKQRVIAKDHPKFEQYKTYLAQCVTADETFNFVRGEDDPDPKDKDCRCKLLDSEGNWTGKWEIYEGTLNEETGEIECPDCEYEEEITKEEEGIEYEDPARWSDRAIGNLITQTRLRTDAGRLDPTLIDTPDYSPAKKRRYDQDIQSNLFGLRKSIDSGGGTAQEQLFKNLAALETGLTQIGKRQKDTEDYNVNVENQAAQIYANLKAGTDAKNQAYLDRARGTNLAQADKETAAKNAKMQVINRAKTDAQNEMIQKATWNFNNPEFQIDYATGMPFFDPHYRDANPTKGQQDVVAVYQDILGRIGDTKNAQNKEIALNLARQKVYGPQKTQFGGYVYGNSMFPFFNE